MHSYILNGEKIRVRMTEQGDLKYVMQTETDAMHAKFIGQNSPEEHIAMMRHPDILHLIIEENESKLPVGYMIIAGKKNIDNAVEIRRIAISNKQQGYGSEALELAVKLSFEELSAHRVWLDVRVHNEIAQHAYESAGFVYEGVLRDAARLGDKYESVKIYSMLRPEYDAL